MVIFPLVQSKWYCAVPVHRSVSISHSRVCYWAWFSDLSKLKASSFDHHKESIILQCPSHKVSCDSVLLLHINFRCVLQPQLDGDHVKPSMIELVWSSKQS